MKAASDQFEAAVIARATEWVTTRFLGTGAYDTRRFDNAAAAWADARGDRAALLYARTPDGFQVHVGNGDSLPPLPENEMKTFSSKSNAIRQAKADLGADAIAGIDFKVSFAGDRWSWQPLPPKAPAPAPAEGAAPKAPKEPGARKAAVEAAQRGEMPEIPDFSKPTHARFRKTLAELVELANQGDVAGLRAVAINPISSSRVAMDRFRNLCVTALEARAAKKAA